MRGKRRGATGAVMLRRAFQVDERTKEIGGVREINIKKNGPARFFIHTSKIKLRLSMTSPKMFGTVVNHGPTAAGDQISHFSF